MYNLFMSKIDFVISRKESEKTAKEFLRECGVSSSLLKKLKNSQNGILINGKSARSIDRIFEGDTLTKMCIRYSTCHIRA